METREFTITIYGDRHKAQKRKAMWRIYSRLSLLAVAAMFTARLLLLMVDVIQLHIHTAGAVSVPACAVVLVLTGWKMREWTGGKERKTCTNTTVTTAGRRLTHAKSATASGKRMEK